MHLHVLVLLSMIVSGIIETNPTSQIPNCIIIIPETLIVVLQVIEYYTRCSRTNNHTVREAACTCIAELASKIDPDAVRPHVPAMLRTLITCLRDDSWPVCHHPL